MTGEPPRILVVGGGPAGLASALAARQRGFEVDLLDRASPPIDKACGEGLMPAALGPLAQLGVDLSTVPAREFDGVRYFDGERVAEGRFSSGSGLGMRRLALHDALLEAAESAGVHCHWGVTIKDAHAGPDGWILESSSGRWQAEWIVAADGLHSRLRRWAGLAGREARRKRFGVRRHFVMEPWSRFVEVYWADGCEAYVTPVADDLVGVAILWSGHKAGFDDLIDRFPLLETRIAMAETASKDRGAGPFSQSVRGAVRGNLVLVGDAGGYVDALTGEGLAIAFREALALSEALAAGDLRLYEASRRHIVRAPELLTKCTLLLSRFPRLRPRVIRSLAQDGALFSRLLAVQNHELSLARDGAAALLKLVGRSLLSGRG